MVGFGILLALLLLGFLAGTAAEKKHLANLSVRESQRRVVITNLKHPPAGMRVANASMVMGHCVVATDYFKTFVAGLKNLIGGELKSYQTLLTRSRREALARLAEAAEAMGADMVINVRFETSTISAVSGNKGAAQVEILAYGTAIVTAPGAATDAGEKGVGFGDGSASDSATGSAAGA